MFYSQHWTVMAKTFVNFWIICLGFVDFLQADFSVKPEMKQHQEIKYDIVYNNQGLPVGIDFWAYNLQVPIIDGMVWWPDAIGYTLHAWYDFGEEKNQLSKDVHQEQPKIQPEQPVEHQLQKKSFQIQRPRIEYVPPEAPQSLNIVYGNQVPQAAGCYIRVKANSCNKFYGGVSSMLDKDFANWWFAAMAYKKYCRMKYHMTPEQKDKMMSACRYKKFTQQLLEDDTLSDDVVLELWQQFCDSKSWPFGNDRRECDQEIKCELRRRNEVRGEVAKQNLENMCRARAAQVQAEIDRKNCEFAQKQEIACVQTATKKYLSVILQNSDYISPYQEQREDALQKTIDQNYKQEVQSHEIDAQTAGMLQAEGIDLHQFQSLSGTIFQHQLFSEVAHHYKNAAKIMFEYSIKNSCMVPHILEFAQATFDATKMEQLGLAVQLSDVVQVLAEISLSICKGPIQSLCCLAENLYHPKKTVKQLGQVLVPILRTLGGAMAEYDHEGSACVTSMRAAQEAFGGDMQSFNQVCDLSRHVFLHWYEHSSDQDKIQAVSRVISDIVLQPFLIGKAGKVCWGLVSQARELQALDGLTCLSEELGFAEIMEDLAQVASKEENLITTVGDIETSMGSLLEAEVAIAKYGVNFAEITEISKFIEEFHKFKGMISPSDKMLVKQVDKALKRVSKKLDQNSIKHLTQSYAQRQIGETTVYAALDHFCNPELGLMKCKTTGDMVLNISGGHLYGVCESIERAGFVKIKEVVTLPSGALHYFMEDVFTGRILQKTIVPKSWDAKKLCDAAWELYENCTDVVVVQKDIFKHVGYIDGVQMELYYTAKSDNSIIHKIITSYPLGLKKEINI